MEYVYAAMLVHSAGREVTEESVSSVLEAVDVDVDGSRVKALVAALEDVDIEEAMAQSAAAPTATPAAPAAAPEAAEEEGEEEAEEEEEEEEAEEEAAEGLGALFG